MNRRFYDKFNGWRLYKVINSFEFRYAWVNIEMSQPRSMVMVFTQARNVLSTRLVDDQLVYSMQSNKSMTMYDPRHTDANPGYSSYSWQKCNVRDCFIGRDTIWIVSMIAVISRIGLEISQTLTSTELP